MKKMLHEELSKEHVFIAKCIFKGLTIAQIAQKMNCSQSTVSNKMCSLFQKYSAKSRFQFILSVFGEIIGNNKLTIDKQLNKICLMSCKIDELKKIILGLVNNKDKKDNYNYNYWLSEAKKYI